MTRQTGFGPEVTAAIIFRDLGRCVLAGILPGCTVKATTANHRRNRQMGGARFRNGMSNGCAICDSCNDAIERDADAAEEARSRGVKLREGDDPATTRMWSVVFRQWVQPTDDGMDLLGGTYHEP